MKALLFLLCALCVFAPLRSPAQQYRFVAPPIRPDAKLTPGATLNVTVEQLSVKGYANVNGGGVRNVPQSLKRKVFLAYFGQVPPNPGDFEIDHLISLEIGGSNDISNLWPQSYQTQPFNSHVKDKLEDRCAALVRQTLKAKGHAAATALLKQIQHEIATDWIAAFHKYVSPTP